MNYIYMIQRNQDQIPIGPNGAPHPGYNHDKVKLTHKYENLLNQSRELCKKYTGPHSVLQIFLEKIIECIGEIAY